MIPKSAKVTISVAVAIILLAVTFLLLFGYQSFAMLTMRSEVARFPVMDKTPIALTDFSVSRGSGKPISRFGYEFEVPWTDIDETKSIEFPDRIVIAFNSNKAMTFAAFPPHEFIDGVASTMHSTPEKLRAAFGEEATSDYEFKKLILNTTAHQMTFLTPWRQCNSMEMLLMFKAVMLPAPDIDLFSLEVHGFKGFQFGDPNRRPRKIGLELYSQEGMVEFYVFQKADGQAAGISQEDLNYIMQSLHRTANLKTALAK